jgi:hypothetical protein
MRILKLGMIGLIGLKPRKLSSLFIMVDRKKLECYSCGVNYCGDKHCPFTTTEGVEMQELQNELKALRAEFKEAISKLNRNLNSIDKDIKQLADSTDTILESNIDNLNRRYPVSGKLSDL